MVPICTGGSPAPGRGPSRNEMPYASSMAGTAILPSRVSGSSSTRGSRRWNTDSSSPAREPEHQGVLERLPEASGAPLAAGLPRLVADHRAVEHGEAHGLQHHQLGQQHGGDERRVAQHVRRDRQTQVACVHVRGGEGADDRVTRVAVPDQAGEHEVGRGRDGNPAERGDQVGREQLRHLGPAEHGDHQGRAGDIEREPCQHALAGGVQDLEVREQGAEADDQPERGEPGQDTLHGLHVTGSGPAV